MDYPLCAPGLRGGIPEFKDLVRNRMTEFKDLVRIPRVTLCMQVLCCTGFTDETAITHRDIEDMVEVVGASFCGELEKKRCTHLIAYQ